MKTISIVEYLAIAAIVLGVILLSGCAEIEVHKKYNKRLVLVRGPVYICGSPNDEGQVICKKK